MTKIPFNKPYLTGKETHYIYQAVYSGKISGNGIFTNKCQDFFTEKYGFRKTLLTTSCTDALEMAALLVGIKPGDEVIMPSYTFVSTANAFVLRGAKIIFADSRKDHPGIDEEGIEKLITQRTKAIVVVHYAGTACNMDIIMEIATKHNVFVIEDAAQAIDNYYTNSKGEQKPLGSIGHLAAFSFHETKNIISGEGGMLVINDKQFEKSAEIIWEKGTNRAAFFRGEVDKYGWVDVGSSFLPSEIMAAFLWAQLEQIDLIQTKRKQIWDYYNEALRDWVNNYSIQSPFIPNYSTNNAHMYYIVMNSEGDRNSLLEVLKSNQIHGTFHYQSLHKSTFFLQNNELSILPESDRYSNNLIRLPLFFELTKEELKKIVNTIISFVPNK